MSGEVNMLAERMRQLYLWDVCDVSISRREEVHFAVRGSLCLMLITAGLSDTV